MGKISKKKVESRDLTSSNIKEDDDFQKFKALYDELKSKYNLTSTELINKTEEKEPIIPQPDDEKNVDKKGNSESEIFVFQ